MRILLTGAGGAAAISVWKSLSAEHEIFMADIDPCAAGLYLVPAERRLIIPKGNHASFIETLLKLCELHHINLFIPTVDTELAPVSAAMNAFHAINTKVPLSTPAALKTCFDKYALLNHCQSVIPVPNFILLNRENINTLTDFPYFAKPRSGAGSTGAIVIRDKSMLATLPLDNSYLVQELLPGDEYSVDTYFDVNHQPIAAVPRLRMKIDSGIAVASRSVKSPTLEQLAIKTGQAVGIQYVANIQFKQAKDGTFKLLEINPRFSGTLPLTCAAGADIPKLMIKEINGEPLTGLVPYRELMVVRYWTEKYIETSEWEALCQH